MGRFTAWMASRRQAKHAANTASRARRHARPLSFERCEQRIALSTNAPYDDPSQSVSTHEDGGISGEGGVIVWANGASIEQAGWQLSWKTNSALIFDSDYGLWSNLGATSTDLSSYLHSRALLGEPYSGQLQPIELSRFGSNFRIQPHSASVGSLDTLGELDFTGVFITDSHIVPIPPPAIEPGGGNEGGHIAMTPFIAPSMLGLPGGSQSQLAAETRQSLTAEQLNPAPVSGSAQDDSLQGRAVVYEVAHARPLNVEATNVASRQRKLDAPADDAATRGAFEFVMNDSPRPVESQTQAVLATVSSGATEAQATRATLAVERADVAIADHDVPFLHETLRVEARKQAQRPNEASTRAAAHDAAIEELDDQFEPISDDRDGVAATVDMHGKRVLGGALIAVAAIPVAKVVRRQSQRSVENRPRRADI